MTNNYQLCYNHYKILHFMRINKDSSLISNIYLSVETQNCRPQQTAPDFKAKAKETKAQKQKYRSSLDENRQFIRCWLEQLMDNHLTSIQSLSVDAKLQELIVLTSELLNDLIEQQGQPCDSIFNSTSVPIISIPQFLRRLQRITRFSAECLVISIIYIDRYNLVMENFSLNNLNVHKTVLTAVLLATKFQDDFYYDNKAFQAAGGVNVAHLQQLELQIFQKLNYNLYVSLQDYEQLQAKLYEVYGSQQQS